MTMQARIALDGSTAALAIPAPIDPVLIDIHAKTCKFDGTQHTEFKPCNGSRCDRACYRFRQEERQ